MGEEYDAGFRAGFMAGMRVGGDSGLGLEGLPTGSSSIKVRTSKKVRRRSGRKDPRMARALRKANSMGRKKSGGFKKGWSQGKIMKKAHQLRRKMR